MKKLFSVFLGLIILLSVSNAHAKELTIEEVQDAVCRVTTTTTNTSWWGGTGSSHSMGTGTVYKEDANNYYIVTNGHVVGRAQKATVEFFKSGYKSAVIPAKIEFVAFKDGTSLDMALLSIPKSTFANTAIKPRVIQFAPEAFSLKPKDKIYGAGFPAGRWCQLWFARIYSDNGNTISFNMPPEGGQSGTAVLTTITDAKGDKHTAISGILSWRYGHDGQQQWGGGLSIKRAYEIFKSRKPSEDRIPSSWKCVSEVEVCRKCRKAPGDHYVIYNPSTNRGALMSDGNTALYCYVPTASSPNSVIITYKDYLVKRPGCDRPNPKPGPDNDGPPSEDGPPNGGIWPDDLEPNPAPPSDEPTPPVEAPKPDPRLIELENRIASLNNQIKALEGSNAGLDAQVKVFKDQLAKLEAEKKALEDAKKASDAAKTAAEKTAAEKAAALAATQADLDKAKGLNNEITGKLKQSAEINVERAAKLAETEKKLNETTTKVAAVEAEKVSIAEQLKNALGSKEDLAKRLEELANANKDSLNKLNIPYISEAFGGFGEFLTMIFGAIASGAVFTTIWHKFVYPQLIKRLGWFPTQIIGFIGKRKLRKYLEPQKKSSDETVGSGYNNDSGQDVIPVAPPAPYLQPESSIELPEAMIKDIATRPVANKSITVSIGKLPEKPVVSPNTDYPTAFFAQNNNSFNGMSVREWAIKSGLYKIAVQKLGAGQLVLSGGNTPANGKKAAQAIDDYVTDRFIDQIRLSNMEPVGNLYHEAFLGYLYWEAVQKLGRGEFSVLGHKEAAEAVERYVKNEFMKKVR